MAPTLGLKPTAPQKLDGRRIEPTTWVPSPTGTMPAPTAADEPLDEPPGVRFGSWGFWVLCQGWVAANSVVVVLPRMMAPASRSAWTLAESRRVSWPSHIGEPWPVGMSAVSMMSLMAIGMPSIGDSGLPVVRAGVWGGGGLGFGAGVGGGGFGWWWCGGGGWRRLRGAQGGRGMGGGFPAPPTSAGRGGRAWLRPRECP